MPEPGEDWSLTSLRSRAVRVSASEAAPKGRAKSRLGKKLILVPLDPEMHLKLRHRALDEGPDGRGIRASSYSSLSF
jgi:hypothetical protein